MAFVGSRVENVKIGTAISTEHDSLEAGTVAGRAVAEELGGAAADLAVVFASGTHLVAPEAMLEGVQSALSPGALVGCGAGGVLGAGRELESGTALAVWAAALDGEASVTPFHASLGEGDEEHQLEGLPPLESSSGVIMLSDPFSFPTDGVLAALSDHAPAVPVLGGISSARTPAEQGALFFGDEVRERGAVGANFEGVEMLPCVSQGAAPVGREITITAAEGNVIYELAGRPALETLQLIISELDQIHIFEEDPAGHLRSLQPGQAHGRQGRDRLSGTGLADDPERLAGVDGVGDAVYGVRLGLPVALHQIFDADHGPSL